MGALLALLPSLLSTVSKFIPDPAAQAQANIELTKVITEQQNAIYDEMSKVMVADAASEGILTRSMRPILCFGFASMAGIIFIAALVDAVVGTHTHTILVQAVKDIPSELWNASVGLAGGYGLLRTAEKITSTLKK